MTSQVVIVMPCLNEEKTITATCNSLGFGLGSSSFNQSAILIIVDNNSTDSTSRIACGIKQLSLQSQVFIVFEYERGFIPARKKGNEFALQICKNNNISIEDILILQIDADTIYPNSYVDSMQVAAEQHGRNYLVEACVDYRPEFRNNHSKYISLLEQTDAKYDWFLKEYQDYIVDDKVVGYWLSDYLKWGGYEREYTEYGSEVFAETTRLFLKGQIFGAKKINIGSIKAFHSERKILVDPAMHFATAGYPRDDNWNDFWRKNGIFVDFQDINDENYREAIYFRSLHIIAMFCILPIHVRRTLSNNEKEKFNPLSQFLLQFIPIRSLYELGNQPALFLTDVFFAIDKEPQIIMSEIDKCLQYFNPQ